MVFGKLICAPNNPRTFKVLITAKYSEVELETTPNFNFGVDNKTPDFLNKFPHGKVPALEQSNGFTVFDSTAISYHIASQNPGSGLLGNTSEEKTHVIQYLFLAEADTLPIAGLCVYPLLGYMPYSKPAFDRASIILKKCLTDLDTILADKSYLVGNHVTLADINIVADLINVFQYLYDETARNEFPNLNRYFDFMINQPNFKAVLGESFHYCVEPLKHPKSSDE